jgi:hypothetical protein
MTLNGGEILEEEMTMEIPEGKEISGAKFYCSKHGDITNAMSTIDMTTLDSDNKQNTSVTVLCLRCLTEYYLKLQKEGEFGTIKISPIFTDKADNDKASDKK